MSRRDRTHGRPRARVGHLRRPGRGGTHLADRRDVPAVARGSASSAAAARASGPNRRPELVHGCCSYGAHFSDKADRDHVVQVGRRSSAPTSGSSPRSAARRASTRRPARTSDGPRVAHAHRTRTRASSSTGSASPPAPAARCTCTRSTGGTHSATSSPRCAGRCRCAASTTSRTTAPSISDLTEFGRDGWGEGGEDFGWWCTEAARGVHRRPSRCTGPWRSSCARCSARSSTSRSSRTSTAGAGVGDVPAGRAPGRGAGEARAARSDRARPRAACYR